MTNNYYGQRRLHKLINRLLYTEAPSVTDESSLTQYISVTNFVLYLIKTQIE